MKRSELRRSTGIASASIKVQRCKAPKCRNPALAYRAFCSPDCGAVIGLAAVEKAKRIEAKRERAQDGIKREELKTLPQLLREAQDAFNAWIRARDASQPCVCCGLPLDSGGVGGGFDAGHYRSVGSAPHLRFNESNVHGQRKVCNRWGAGRAVDYRIGLVRRIGLAAVEDVEANNEVVKWTKQQVREIRDSYRQKVKELKKEAS